MKPTCRDAYQLVHEGSLALAEVESVGIRIDVDRLNRTIQDTKQRIGELEEELRADDVWRLWKRRFGVKSNLGSRTQLGKILFEEMEYKRQGRTATGRSKVDEAALEGVDLPFVKRLLQTEKLKKLKSTYLQGVRREVVDGFLHPVFSLHLARTHRSSSERPNFQNIPIRDPEIGRLIRSCFIPRPGHVLVEIDYSALEFRGAACFWRDENMVAYASNPAKDVHRDMARECYLLDDDQWTKQTRFYAKNQFVFPTLYGSFYANTAQSLWNAIGQHGLTTQDGTPLYDHLRSQGIRELGECDFSKGARPGTFEYHVAQVEERFNRRFPEWSRRKDQWLRRYRERGWFDTMTGFRCVGVYSRNDLFNYPIQGPCFHCLLWSLIQMVKWLRRNKMRSVVVGQIHDSLVGDVHRDELDEYLAKAKQVMTEDIRRHWSWIITPLEIEAEVAETNWFEKKAVEL